MARKRSPAKAAAPTPRGVDEALRAADYADATAMARQLVTLLPTSQTEYVNTLSAVYEGYTRQGKTKPALETLKAAEEFAASYPNVAEDVAALHARAGEFATAFQFANSPRVVRHAADWCVRHNRAADAPPDVQAGLPLIQQAFQRYEDGLDEAAKETLQGVGLASPFLEWKVLLRGLMAFAAGDAARAVENWQRLAPEYLPAKLAAVPRSALDPAFRAAQSAHAAASLREQAEALFANDLLPGLRAVQKKLGRDQRLQPVWKEVERLVPRLKAAHPPLFAKLGAVLYEAIIRQGESTDLKKYRTLFPAPADDPQYHRLEAMACEAAQELDVAVEHWQKYEAWLAGAGWPAAMADRARATILHRVGDILGDLGTADDTPPEFEAVFRSLMGRLPRRAKPAGNPLDFYRRSAALAPDWPPPFYDLFDRQIEAKAAAAAEKTARDFLTRRPQDLPMLERLATLYRGQRRMADALAVQQQALTANPLDGNLIDQVGIAYLATIRRHLIDGDLAGCERLIAEATELVAKRFPAAFGSLKATALRKAGDNDAAAAVEAELYTDRLRQPCVAFDLSVDGLLAKLKPAQRKAADARLKEALANPAPHPSEVYYLYGSWIMFADEGVTYRGQPTHEKKIVELALRSLKAEATEVDFESVAMALSQRKQSKALQKFLPTLVTRFPHWPLFLLLEAKRLYFDGRGYGIEYRIIRLLDDAKRAAEASTRPQDKRLLDGIDQLRKSMQGGGLVSPFDDDDEDF